MSLEQAERRSGLNRRQLGALLVVGSFLVGGVAFLLYHGHLASHVSAKALASIPAANNADAPGRGIGIDCGTFPSTTVSGDVLSQVWPTDPATDPNVNMSVAQDVTWSNVLTSCEQAHSQRRALIEGVGALALVVFVLGLVVGLG